MFHKLDEFLIEQTQTSLDFLNDWIGITQRTVEKTLPKIYLGTVIVQAVFHCMIPKHNFWGTFILLLCGVLIYGTMIVDKHKSNSSRQIERNFQFYRLYWPLVAVLWVGFIMVPPHGLGYDGEAIATLVLHVSKGAMSYVIVCNVDGEKRKKAKLALSKLKELFGKTNWIPQPVGA